jgi:hypothetical protein
MFWKLITRVRKIFLSLIWNVRKTIINFAVSAFKLMGKNLIKNTFEFRVSCFIKKDSIFIQKVYWVLLQLRLTAAATWFFDKQSKLDRMIGNYAFLQHTKIMFSQILKFWNFNQGNQSIHEGNSKENIYRNNIYFNCWKQFWLK